MQLKAPVRVVLGLVGKTGPETWGYYQFPDMWRIAGGEIRLCVNVGPDSALGRHDPSIWFASNSPGRRWRQIRREQVDLTPDIHALPDGRQVKIGSQRYVYHWSAYGPGNRWRRIFLRQLDIKPTFGPWFDDYGQCEQVAYRMGDIAASARRFALAVQPAPDEPWQKTTGIVDVPDLLVRATVRAKAWFDKDRADIWQEVDPSFALPIPVRVTVLPDGTMLTAISGQNPRVTDRRYDQVICLASADAGQTWRQCGTIADDTGQTTHGYGAGEQEIALMPDGDLLCVMRTQMSAHKEDSHFLAAARSSDGGATWTRPSKIAEFSVTPHLLALKNGKVAVVYGRPGVYVRTSDDGGRSWGPSVAVVGPDEEDLRSQPAETWFDHGQLAYTCANTDVVLSGPDRFLLAYSDFQHPSPYGGRRKAILIREIIVA